MTVARQLEEALQESYATPEPGDVWPKDISVVSSKWTGDGKDLRFTVVFKVKGKQYEVSTPAVGMDGQKKTDSDVVSKGKVWLRSMQAELAQLLRKGRSRKLVDPKTGRPSKPSDTKLRIV
jgi:hypothetical protein